MTYRSKVAVVYLLGFFLDLINMFIASVAFPAMAHAFNTTPSALAWVSNGYIAGLTLVIPFSSVLTRRIGPKRVILLSLFSFNLWAATEVEVREALITQNCLARLKLELAEYKKIPNLIFHKLSLRFFYISYFC